MEGGAEKLDFKMEIHYDLSPDTTLQGTLVSGTVFAKTHTPPHHPVKIFASSGLSNAEDKNQ